MGRDNEKNRGERNEYKINLRGRTNRKVEEKRENLFNAEKSVEEVLAASWLRI